MCCGGTSSLSTVCSARTRPNARAGRHKRAHSHAHTEHAQALAGTGVATCPAVSQIFRLIMVPSTTMRFARYVPPIVPEACASGLRAGGVRVYPRSARIARTRKGGHMHACTRKRRIPACRCTCPERSAAAVPSAQPGHQQPLAQHPFAQPGARRNNAAAPPITFPTPLSPTATTLRAMQSPSIFSPCTIVDGRPPGYPGASSERGARRLC